MAPALPTRALPFALGMLFLLACGGSSDVVPPPPPPPPPTGVIVNSLEDVASPPVGTTTLRSAIAAAGSGETITFDPSLNGQTILLSVVGEKHTTLKGEVYSGMTFVGYEDRDYGASALYARKDVVIDASALPDGLTIKWNGGDASRARVMAVHGNLTLKNVTITGGHSDAVSIAPAPQAYTLARGGGLAVGVGSTLTLDRVTVAGNRCTGDPEASRDRGTFGGGIYTAGLHMTASVVSGNSASGYGAAGGGIYAIGYDDIVLERCTVSGNRARGQHSYGGGIFTLAIGPYNQGVMYLIDCTVARNLVEDNPDIPDVGQYYYRGGGIYMGGGSLSVVSSTIVENAVTGPAAIFNGAPNVGGGGVAATIGNAHVVETAELQGSIVAGNTLNGAPEDWFTGSILLFSSQGYNLVGYVDFRYILAPIPEWHSLCRKHWPKVGDHDGVTLAQVVDVANAQTLASIPSAGTDAGQPVVLWYPPAGMARDGIPAAPYGVTYVSVGYSGFGVPTDDFLNHLLLQIRAVDGATLGADFGASYGDLTGTTYWGPKATWPSNPQNAPWIAFWRDLDTTIAGRLGMAGLNDDFWATFSPGPLGHVSIDFTNSAQQFSLTAIDQLGHSRPVGGLGDIGAIER